MTRKDYILIADIVVEQYKADPDHHLERLITSATRILEPSSVSFDPQKFRNYILKKLNHA